MADGYYILSAVCFLTLLIDVFLVFCAKAELIFFVVSACNCAGCFYDIVDALIAANK